MHLQPATPPGLIETTHFLFFSLALTKTTIYQPVSTSKTQELQPITLISNPRQQYSSTTAILEVETFQVVSDNFDSLVSVSLL